MVLKGTRKVVNGCVLGTETRVKDGTETRCGEVYKERSRWERAK